jgi:hypothetical protein
MSRVLMTRAAGYSSPTVASYCWIGCSPSIIVQHFVMSNVFFIICIQHYITIHFGKKYIMMVREVRKYASIF